MSGRDLVDEMRSKPAPKARGALSAMDVLIGVAVVVALGSLGYFGVTSLLGSPRPPAPQPVVASVVAPHVAVVQTIWTDADTANCKARAQAAAENPWVPEASMPPNPAVAEGYAGLATMVECRLVTKPMRFCDAAQKAALVEMIKDYRNRSDLVIAGLGVEGAPMKIMGGLFGGEIQAGNDIYQMERESTVAMMKWYDKRVITALRALAKDGVIGPIDFAEFMGGVPEGIELMFAGALPERNVCA